MAVNLTDLLEETVGLVSSVLPSGIKIVSDIPMGKIMIFTNPAQLFRVFLNLITNAVHSMEESGGTLSINAGLVDGNQIRSLFKKNMVADDYVLVTFRDTGSGMEASLMQRIFEPFYTTKEGGKGTGLGLYVVQEIVNEMGGEICVSSKENEGSVFDIYLPVIKE
jgi:signal transduction histidine kinase